ncbi:MAG: hypothetical protein ACRDF6_09280 [bacterium]
MGERTWRFGASMQAAVIIAGLLVLPEGIHAQGRGRGAQPPATGRAAAPIDLTGYWTAVITEDWRWRMVTPAKGDYQSIPITAAAQKIGDGWDPAKDEAAGEQCKAYGAPGLMRAPTRLNVSWLDDNTLKVEADYGMQTRLLHFGNWKSPGGAPTWQGESLARWEGGRGAGAEGTGTLVVRTSNLRPGYLRKNGVPYSANTTMTEYWDLITEPTGERRILLLIVVDDPVYLQQPWTVPVHFKKEPDGSKWDPTPCNAKF